MDKERAKFMLRSFRPDGGDAEDVEFAEALRLAAEDRDLGEWLARERAMDSHFAEALSGAAIPDGLRDEILAVMEFDGRPDEERDEMDVVFIGAMASIHPPAGLRDEILSAMSMETGDEGIRDEGTVVEGHFWKWVTAGAAAAILAVGLLVSMEDGSGYGVEPQIAMQSARVELARVVNEAGAENLDTRGVSRETGLGWLAEEGLPVPEHVPAGLEAAQFLGCKDLVMKNGVHASLLSFDKAGVGRMHLLVFDAEDIADFEKLAPSGTITLKACYTCELTKFNMVSWREGDKAFTLLTKAERREMIRLF